jgi:hypothetical protein
MVIFHSYVSHYQRVAHETIIHQDFFIFQMVESSYFGLLVRRDDQDLPTRKDQPSLTRQ